MLRLSVWSADGIVSIGFDVDTSVSCVYLVAILREADCVPLWSPVVTHGELVQIISRTEILAFSAVSLGMLPLPPMFSLIHAKIRMESEQRLSFHVQTASAEFDREALLPKGVAPALRKNEIHLKQLRAVMTPVDSPTDPQTATDSPSKGMADRAPRTGARGIVQVDVSKLGPRLSMLLQSQFIIGIVVRVLVPLVWRQLAATLTIVSRADSVWASRVARDDTGLYALIREHSGQLDAVAPPPQESKAPQSTLTWLLSAIPNTLAAPFTSL